MRSWQEVNPQCPGCGNTLNQIDTPLFVENPRLVQCVICNLVCIKCGVENITIHWTKPGLGRKSNVKEEEA